MFTLLTHRLSMNVCMEWQLVFTYLYLFTLVSFNIGLTFLTFFLVFLYVLAGYEFQITFIAMKMSNHLCFNLVRNEQCFLTNNMVKVFILVPVCKKNMLMTYFLISNLYLLIKMKKDSQAYNTYVTVYLES